MNDQTTGSGDGDSTAEGEPDPFSVVLDEDFIRAATTKEASAHARMLEQRFRQLEAEHSEQGRTRAGAAGTAGTAGAAGASAQTPANAAGQLGTGTWPIRLLVLALVGLIGFTAIEVWKSHVGENNPFTAPSVVVATKGTPTPGTLTAIAPSLDPSRAAMVDKPWPAIPMTTVFPDSTVKVNGVTLDLVSTAKQVPCDSFASQEMASLIDQGSGCSQLLTALFTTADDKAQFTVNVLTMNRAEDAAAVFGITRTASMTYQMGSMDPPAGSKVPTIPSGNGGVTNCVMAVRSVVFVNAQWVDPSDQDVTTLTADSNSLLSYAEAKVGAYEQSQS